MKYYPEQVELSEIALEILKDYGIVYLAMEERTGKSLTACRIYELCPNIKNILIITTKKAMLGEDGNGGWTKLLKDARGLLTKNYEVINYHSAHKAIMKPDAVILDESHNYVSAYPTRSQIWRGVHKIVKNLPIVYSSATPNAQGYQQLYNQFALSSLYSPWREFKDYYAFYKYYGDRDAAGNYKVIYIGPSRTALDYSAVRQGLIKEDCEHLFVTKTRRELGFEHEPEDKIHYIELSEHTKELYNTFIKDKLLEFEYEGKDYTFVCDTGLKLRWTLHMLEGGTLKHTYYMGSRECHDFLDISNREKIDYILENWGDTDQLAIMYQYTAELYKLQKHFTKAKLLQGQANAEGIDLSHVEHLVIYSQNFSTAKHSQRRARQANKKRGTPIIVHYLLVAKAISDQCYKAVSINKKNFVDSVFEQEEL